MTNFFLSRNEYHDLFQNVGGPCFLIHEKKFLQNYIDLYQALNRKEKIFKVSYSVKTNYLPDLLLEIRDINGNVEVVSEMELDLVIALGFTGDQIIFNGPVKSELSILNALDRCITINIDSLSDLNFVLHIRDKFRPNKIVNLGIRLNYEVQREVSRFGVSVDKTSLEQIFKILSEHEDIIVKQIHSHFQARSLEAWLEKVDLLQASLLQIKQNYEIIPQEVNFGGGMYGPMSGKILDNFSGWTPSYLDYSDLLNHAVEKIRDTVSRDLIFHVEPGTALVADCVEYITPIYSIKKIDNENICILNGTIKDLAAHSGRVKTDLLVIEIGDGERIANSEVKLVGNTCLEKDIITFVDDMAVCEGDLVVFPYCGAYSIVMRPQFIHYMPPIYSVTKISRGDFIPVKRKETIDSIFSEYEVFNKLTGET